MADDAPVSKNSALPALLTLFSPSFPIGGFAWSHGIETAVSDGVLTSAEDVCDWLAYLIESGSGWNDCVLLVESYKAIECRDWAAFERVAALATALVGSKERRAETLSLGAAFAEASHAWRTSPAETAMTEADATWTANGGATAYPVAAGRLASEANLSLAETLMAFLHAFAASIVSASVRLIPLAQSDAVLVMRHLEPTISTMSQRALNSTLDDLGSSALASDIAAMRHETLKTRLFRS